MAANNHNQDRDPRTTPADATVDQSQVDQAHVEGNSAEITRPDADTVPTQQASEKTFDGDRRPLGQSDGEQLPRNVGQYRLLKKLGEGGMGTVYLAEHERLRRPVALKMLTMERMQSAAALARFQREMAAAGQLSHPNIVITHDAGDAEGVHYMAMELIDGVHLGQMLKLGPLPTADACEIARQAALGLDYAHQCNLLHRDIKPSNLMLGWTRASDGNGTTLAVKILDLGLARLDMMPDDEEELTAEGQMMGTIDYVAPEQADGGQVGRWSDIYSLGATLYKMLSGVSPYAESGKSLLEKLAALSRGPAPSIRTRVDLPPQLADLIDAMISPNPADRPASAQVVAERLAEFTTGSDLPTRLEETEAVAGQGSDERTWSVLRQRTPTSSATAPDKQSVTSAPADLGMPAWQWATIAAVAVAIAALLLQGPVIDWLNPDDGAMDAGDDVIVAQGDTSATDDPNDRPNLDVVRRAEPRMLRGDQMDGGGTIGGGMGSTADGGVGDGTGRSGGLGSDGKFGNDPTRNLPHSKIENQTVERHLKLGQPPIEHSIEPSTPRRSPGQPQPGAAQLATEMAQPFAAKSPDSQIALWFSQQGGQVETAPTATSRSVEVQPDNTDRFYIKSLDVNDKVAFRDADVQKLVKLQQLETARLANTDVTDAALPAIAQVTTLRELDLSHTKITSRGIKHLSPLQNLQTLRLRSTSVDDKAVPDLARLKSLRLLDLSKSQVTDAGRQQLIKLLPQVKLP